MSMVSKIKEIVYYTDNEYGIPEKASDFIKYWESKIALVPDEFKDSTNICIESTDDGYGCNTLDVQIYYERPETEEEKAARLDRQNLASERVRNRDLEQYEKIKSKYGL